MQTNRVLLLGGSGFVGRHLAAELANRGFAVSIPCRRPQRLGQLRVLPGINIFAADILNPQQLGPLCQQHDVAINLVGILNESRRNQFRHLHVEFVKSLVNACQENALRRLLHVSALGADQASGSSLYLRSKGEGENLVHTFGRKDLQVTSFQPSVIFGEDDSFLNRFAPMVRYCPGLFPLACAQSRFAPVYVEDVVKRIADAINQPSTYSQRYQLCGPEAYSLGQIVELIAQSLHRRCRVVGLPDSLSRLQAVILQNLPGKLFTLDNYRSLQTPSTCAQASSGCNTSLTEFVRGLDHGFNRRAEYDRYRRQVDATE